MRDGVKWFRRAIVHALLGRSGSSADRPNPKSDSRREVVGPGTNASTQDLESFLGPIVALPEGAAGHTILRDNFLQLIDFLNPSLFCDIGANEGSTGRAALARRPSMQVHGFEANPRIHAEYAEVNGTTGIGWHNLAVTDHSGTVPIYTPRTLSRAYVDGKVVPRAVSEPIQTGKSSLLLRDEDATYERFDVQAVTLDSFVAASNAARDRRNIFLWIDVEGAADRVLAGAGQVLQQTAAIFLEIEGFPFWRDQSDGGNVIGLLRRQGFVPLARDREYGEKQFNVLFVHDSVLPVVREALQNGQLPLSRYLWAATATTQSAAPRSARRSDSNVWRSLCAWRSAEIPILVPCFNNPTYASRMHLQLRECGLDNIVYVDNGSTLPDMLDWLDRIAAETTVIRQTENVGPRHSFLDPSTYALLPRRFCITDPDIEFNAALPRDFLGELAYLMERHRIGKAGFALDISDRHLMNERRYRIGEHDYHVWEWERKFWVDPLDYTAGGDRVYMASIDTTFALYDKHFFDPEDYLRGLRVAGRYTARHLPWYRHEILSEEESRVYRQTQKHSYYCRDSEIK